MLLFAKADAQNGPKEERAENTLADVHKRTVCSMPSDAVGT